jgi:hypothetical protein
MYYCAYRYPFVSFLLGEGFYSVSEGFFLSTFVLSVVVSYLCALLFSYALLFKYQKKEKKEKKRVLDLSAMLSLQEKHTLCGRLHQVCCIMPFCLV